MCERCKKEFVDAMLQRAFVDGKLGELLHEVYDAAYAEGYVDGAHDDEQRVIILDREKP
jgi:hypothetical protein